jgi:hypothetical protein
MRINKDKKMTFSEVEKYLLRKGLKNQIDYSIAINIEVVEFNINGYYFCSVGKYTDNSFELFEQHHGAQISEDRKEYITDGELWQYKVYGSLKRALNFALKCKANNKLPNKALKIW